MDPFEWDQRGHEGDQGLEHLIFEGRLGAGGA